MMDYGKTKSFYLLTMAQEKFFPSSYDARHRQYPGLIANLETFTRIIV